MSDSKPMGPRGRGPGGNFTEGPVHTHIIRLTGFMMMGFVSMIMASLIETVYIGRLGTPQLAAVSFTFPLVMVMQGVAMGLGIGASSVVARTVGMGDRERVRRLVSHCLVLVAILIMILVVVGFSVAEAFFKLLGAQPDILALIIVYMDVWLLGLPLFTLSMVGSSLIRAAGNAAIPGYIMTVGSLLQVTIAPFLIFGLGPFPEMGLEGAAWAFVIARAASFSFTFYYLIRKERLLITSLDGVISSWKDILHVGLPAIATNLIMPVSMGIITRLLASHGPEVVAGYGVGSRVDSLVVMIVMALSSSIGPFVGQNWGAHKYDRVKAALSMANRFSLLWGVFAFIFMLLFGEFLVSLINDDPKVVETAATYLIIIPLSIGFMGIMAVSSSCFNALGKPMPPLIISINRMLVVYVPMALLGDYLWGYVGIFVATSASTILMGTVAWYWNRVVIDKEIAISLQPGLEEGSASVAQQV
jgi:putative MATE family efflux protein